MTTSKYILLTGSKNNAGDYLIKHRAKQLFEKYKPDREIIDCDGWKKLDDNALARINDSKALILMGGPALQKNMYPKIYPLVADLKKITVPIIMMGVGWKSLNGNWLDSRNYKLSSDTKDLIKLTQSHGIMSSVRDYHTLNVLRRHGFDNVLMTGCPATYDLDYIEKGFTSTSEILKIGFSLGVSFLKSKKLEMQMKDMILKVIEIFPKAKFSVVFHHSVASSFLNTHNATSSHLKGHLKFVEWLTKKEISYDDISGSADNLMNFYQSCDLHIGYRVHAHIFMSSISKPTILIAEDGRGKALRDVFGGVVVDAFDNVNDGLIGKVLRRCGIAGGFKVDKYLSDEVGERIKYEIKNSYPQNKAARCVIDENFTVMKEFFKQLP